MIARDDRQAGLTRAALARLFACNRRDLLESRAGTGKNAREKP